MTDRDRDHVEDASPSTGTGSADAVEGSILEDEPSHRGMTASDRGGSGAGAEAAEGIHSAKSGDQRDRSAADPSRDTAGARGEKRPGSEPLEERDAEHKSGYGGEMSEPKTSSDS